jgi:hypothetical protein
VSQAWEPATKSQVPSIKPVARLRSARIWTAVVARRRADCRGLARLQLRLPIVLVLAPRKQSPSPTLARFLEHA